MTGTPLTPDAVQELTIGLSLPELVLIINVLAARPYADVHHLLPRLIAQANEANAASPADTP